MNAWLFCQWKLAINFIVGNGVPLNVAAYQQCLLRSYSQAVQDIYWHISETTFASKKKQTKKREESSETSPEQPENNSPLGKQLWGIKCATARQFYSHTFLQTRLVGLLNVCLGAASKMWQLNTQGKPIQFPTSNNYKHVSTWNEIRT